MKRSLGIYVFVMLERKCMSADITEHFRKYEYCSRAEVFNLTSTGSTENLLTKRNCQHIYVVK
jgi:hypothetical protein